MRRQRKGLIWAKYLEARRGQGGGSLGLSAFVKTFKRDYAYVNELISAASVLAAVPLWMADLQRVAPAPRPRHEVTARVPRCRRE
jgi:hypothetical protein